MKDTIFKQIAYIPPQMAKLVIYSLIVYDTRFHDSDDVRTNLTDHKPLFKKALPFQSYCCNDDDIEININLVYLDYLLYLLQINSILSSKLVPFSLPISKSLKCFLNLLRF